jgi:8-oxo-dGTP diphosphatase
MKLAYGGVVFDDKGRVLLREPRNHFGGYAWTFAKGGSQSGEIPETTALREVREETGVVGRILCPLLDGFRGDTSITYYFLMALEEDKGDFDPEETQTVKWVKPKTAEKYIGMTVSIAGRKRDLEVLEKAIQALREFKRSAPANLK